MGEGCGKGENNTQNRLKLLNKSMPRDAFVTMFLEEMPTFAEHVRRAGVQYKAFRTLRVSLQPGEVTCQMDFAENWNTDQLNQVQSAYFDRDSVTIHPCVVQLPGQESAASYAFIAADKSHNANMEYAVVKALISDLNCLFVCGISLTSGQLVSGLFPDCTRSCFSQVVLRRRGGDCIYEMRCLFVAVGPNARFIVLPHWDNMS